MCVCVSVWARVCFREGKSEDEGFTLTEHANASARSNYHATKHIQGVAQEVRVGMNACFKDDFLST